jgi:hypothetical protein
MFTPNNDTVNHGMPLTARGDITGPTGGYGWIINFNQSAPRFIEFTLSEIHPDSTLFVSIPYPMNTIFTITENSVGCWRDSQYTCTEIYQAASSIDEVRLGPGNKYYVDADGVVTFRIIQIPNRFTGNPNWMIPNYSTPARSAEDVWSIPRFNRNGVVLPNLQYGSSYTLQAKCPSDDNNSSTTGYCPEPITTLNDPDVCPIGYKQTAYDTCCQSSDLAKCQYSDGSRNF